MSIINYGDTIDLRNTDSGENLSTCDISMCGFNVSTRKDAERINHHWVITSNIKATGTPVLYGDTGIILTSTVNVGYSLISCSQDASRIKCPNNINIAASLTSQHFFTFLSSSGKSTGSPVMSTDLIYMQDTLLGSGYWVQTCDYFSGETNPCGINVTATQSPSREATRQWTVTLRSSPIIPVGPPPIIPITPAIPPASLLSLVPSTETKSIFSEWWFWLIVIAITLLIIGIVVYLIIKG